MRTRATIHSRAERYDRVRAHSDVSINEEIDREIAMRLHYYAAQGEDAIGGRLDELNAEADIEQVLEANAASLALLGVSLGAMFSRKWLLLPIGVTGFLLQHAVQGWCPPVPLMRRLGIRTRKEIEKERYALMALRGDFDDLETDGPPREQVGHILERLSRR